MDDICYDHAVRSTPIARVSHFHNATYGIATDDNREDADCVFVSQANDQSTVNGEAYASADSAAQVVIEPSNRQNKSEVRQPMTVREVLQKAHVWRRDRRDVHAASKPGKGVITWLSRSGK